MHLNTNPAPLSETLTEAVQVPSVLREWPTIVLYLLAWGAILGALALPAGSPLLASALLVPALVLHSSLSHEILHGHPVRSQGPQLAMGLIQPGLFIPYLRFRALHLAHHQDESLTDPYDDPESNYMDPARWARLPAPVRLLLLANNTLAGRMALGPAIGLVQFALDDLRRLRGGEGRVFWHWAAHLPGLLLVLRLVQLSALPMWAYLAACYGALSILKIRTFLEHRAHHAAAARTVVIEDHGPLALLFLNNNFHALHHAQPRLPWYDLPRVYAQRRAEVLADNGAYRYRSYGAVFRSYLFRRKDPVPHPLWPKDRG
ncbi:MAG: fatty acid desaturase [Sulfitobacter sp.]|nr:fatty acid desaturase [Sulfitobacter sp.]